MTTRARTGLGHYLVVNVHHGVFLATLMTGALALIVGVGVSLLHVDEHAGLGVLLGGLVLLGLTVAFVAEGAGSGAWRREVQAMRATERGSTWGADSVTRPLQVVCEADGCGVADAPEQGDQEVVRPALFGRLLHRVPAARGGRHRSGPGRPAFRP